MKKIGIVTLFGNYNYGNRLQNYAMQQILSNCGCRSYSIVNEKSIIKYWARFVKKTLLKIGGDAVSKRYLSFERFNKSYICRDIWFGKKCFQKNEKKYDLFVVGSDQVWNPNIRVDQRDFFFLTFTTKDKRRCISPSIGVKKIKDQYEAEYVKYFSGFEQLSCREKSGAIEIERISGRKCNVLIDPTMALSGEEWKKIEDETRVPNEKYYISYFIGGIDNLLDEKINEISKKNGITVINPSNIDSDYYDASPTEMLALIDNASFVFTNSFHLIAFSIVFNTQFYAFARDNGENENQSINSRIIDLLSNLGLENRLITDNVVDVNKTIDFSACNQALEDEINSFNEYVNMIIGEFDEE